MWQMEPRIPERWGPSGRQMPEGQSTFNKLGSSSSLCLSSSTPSPGVLKPRPVSVSPGLPKHRWLGPTSKVSDSAGLGQGLRTCVSYTFPGDAEVLVHAHTLRTLTLPLVKEIETILKCTSLGKDQLFIAGARR